MEIDGFDDDRWGICLCRNSVGGSIKGEETRKGNEKESKARVEGYLKYENENGLRIKGHGTYGVNRDNQGQWSQEMEGGLEADFPFWLKV